jgi:hypothetical protein
MSKEPTVGGRGRAGSRNGGAYARDQQIARLLLRDDLCGFPGGSQSGRRKPRGPDSFAAADLQIIAAGAANQFRHEIKGPLCRA